MDSNEEAVSLNGQSHYKTVEEFVQGKQERREGLDCGTFESRWKRQSLWK
jgi:hypothetical protein